ncbi:HAMP domain-containing histidine kinase [Microbispora sp. RL4-1S]|uniref:histidine kinase n=1 Tax=Microbispora oryzae TaxID=2806554 RepID=A0A940WEC0_9ACTN|nr:HAMP domain-containing sensor histidine kinase [Microbispora oryzae]MBP2703073.1 HAMP domain-containing histidine kinase [Microbispora oryzae]
MTSAALSLIVFTLIGIGADLAIRNKIQDHLRAETQRVATSWIATMRPGRVSPPPMTNTYLIQLVDSTGHVVAASDAAKGRPPLTSPMPPAEDRIQYRTSCADDTCVELTAIRLLPFQSGLMWNGEPHAVYVGRAQPKMLSTHRLEVAVAAAVVAGTALWSWTNWFLVRRMLRPMTAIRAKMSQITASDLSMRVPQPPGLDEVARLATTANETLDRLEAAVIQQRRFASVVSHELRSPLAGLRAQLEEALIYRDEVDPYTTIKDALNTTDRAQAIIDDVLTWARIDSAHDVAPVPVDLAALVRDEVTARSPGKPVLADVTGPLTVLGSGIRLTRLLTNLLVNAQRHAHTGVRVTAERRDGEAVVTVLDDGDGIAPGDRERVFEPFVRLEDGLRRDPNGTGLGLAISRAVAEAHHGSLRVEDSQKGARFVLRLPLHVSARPAGDPPASAGPQPPGARERTGASPAVMSRRRLADRAC